MIVKTSPMVRCSSIEKYKYLSVTVACPGPVLLPGAGAHGGDQHRDPGLRRLHPHRHRQARGHRRERDHRGGDQAEPLRGVRAGHTVVAVLVL